MNKPPTGLIVFLVWWFGSRAIGEMVKGRNIRDAFKDESSSGVNGWSILLALWVLGGILLAAYSVLSFTP
jgi:hypothetical protein